MFRFVRFPVFALAAALCLSALGKGQPKDSSKPDLAALLQEVADKYAHAKSYNIESIEEREMDSDLSRQWDKSFINAALTSGNRYRFEGRNNAGWEIKISDGRTEWIFNPAGKMYTQKPAPEAGPSKFNGPIFPGQIALLEAQNLPHSLSVKARDLLNAAYVKDETLTLNGKQVPCYVVSGTGKYHGGSTDAVHRLTIWIDKDSHTLRKVHSHSEGALIINSPYVREVEDETILYPVVDLDPPSLPDSIFKFEPPATAKLVEEFPDPMNPDTHELVGKAAPDVKLQAADGKSVSLSTFRGKPVLLDFWATWCAPCVSSMPPLVKIFHETSTHGLILISIDEDEEAKTAAEFWSKHAEPWSNFHDDDGGIQREFAPGGVPELVLIDSSGKITYASAGFHESALRGAIAKLGPEFAWLDTKPAAK